MIDADNHLINAKLYQGADEIVPVATSPFECDGTQAGEMFSPSTRVDTPDTPSAKQMMRKRQMGVKSDIKEHPERDGGLYTDPCECRSEWCIQCIDQRILQRLTQRATRCKMTRGELTGTYDAP